MATTTKKKTTGKAAAKAAAKPAKTIKPAIKKCWEEPEEAPQAQNRSPRMGPSEPLTPTDENNSLLQDTQAIKSTIRATEKLAASLSPVLVAFRKVCPTFPLSELLVYWHQPKTVTAERIKRDIVKYNTDGRPFDIDGMPVAFDKAVELIDIPEVPQLVEAVNQSIAQHNPLDRYSPRADLLEALLDGKITFDHSKIVRQYTHELNGRQSKEYEYLSILALMLNDHLKRHRMSTAQHNNRPLLHIDGLKVITQSSGGQMAGIERFEVDADYILNY